MVISIASGKGGTGKTTVASSLAYTITDCVYIDCDVEEPNGHLFLKPKIDSEEKVYKKLPVIDQSKCTFCGKCIEVCEFNALINLKSEIVLFEEMCRWCGVCKYFCPSKAIEETEKEIGILRHGIVNEQLMFADGILKVGGASAEPLINKTKEKIVAGKINIIDSPPGTSCSMIESVKDSDFCILVTESTPFGLSDLKLAVDVLEIIGIPFGVAINKYDPNFFELEEYLNKKMIDILLKIPFDRKIAESYSKGILPVKNNNELKNDFLKLINKIEMKVELVKANVG